jgi:DNA/RNA-binding domain of Phe-tRNA-synthetase-like protein
VHLAGRLTLADERGPFGNPTSDSWRTRVTTHTTRALVVIFVPAALPPDVGHRAVSLTRARIGEHCA